MRASRRKNAKGKIVIRSAACALGLLLAPVSARSADNPAKLTVEDCYGDSEHRYPSAQVYGVSGLDTCWSGKHDSDFSHVHASVLVLPSSPPVPPVGRPDVHMSCSLKPHHHDCRRSEYCARTPDRDGPRFLEVTFEFGRLRPEAEPKRTRRRRDRRRRDQEAPLRVGLWSKFHAGDAAAEGAYTLRHEVAHYPRAKVGYSGRLLYEFDVRGVRAAGLIRKLHRADNFGWTDDETGQSSYLVTVDEGLREQIGLFMKRCGIDPAPAP